MKTFFLWSVLLTSLFTGQWLHAQTERPAPNLQPQLAKNIYPQTKVFNANQVFTLAPDNTSLANSVSKATYLNLKTDKLAEIMLEEPRQMRFEFPLANGEKIAFDLQQANLLTDNFQVQASDNQTISWKPGLYYRGHVIDREKKLGKTFAAISFFNDQVFGVVSVEGVTYNLGFIGDRTQAATNDYIFYAENDLAVSNTTDCHTNTEGITVLPEQLAFDEKSANRKMFTEYLVIDQNTYLSFGSNSGAALNYTSALYNAVAFMYEREDISTLIEYFFIWTSTDPYNDTNTSTQLGDFNNWLDAFSSGQISLSHLISTGASGGRAYIDVLCDSDTGVKSGVSNINLTYNQIPTYSWSVMVVTHEIGHNLGSPHTHDCSWNGNNTRIDNCGGNAGYPGDGSCTNNPTVNNGGTVMSYCHLTSDGINLTNGFGPLPGNLIRSRINAATCLLTAGLNSSGYTEIGCGQTLSGSNVGATNYVSTYFNYSDYTSDINGSPTPWSETGGEVVYKVQLQEAVTSLIASLSNTSADVDVFILSSANEYTTLAYGNFSATTGALPAGTYWIVVDGYNGASGTYDLSLSCSSLCASWGNTADEWLQTTTIGNISNTSGNNEGYANYEYLSLNCGVGDVVSVVLTPGYTSTAYTESFKVFVDWNQDNDYFDAGEEVYTGSANAVNSGSFTVPVGAALGNTTMRVVMAFGSAQVCGDYSFGETEDYTVNVSEYCLTAGNAVDEYIDAFTVGTQTSTTGNNNGFYVSPLEINLQAGVPTSGSFTPGYTGTAYSETWRWFADFIVNGIFETTILNLPAASNTQTGNVTVPYWVEGGYYKSRLVMSYFTPAADPCADGFYGETEQYDLAVCGYKAGNTLYEYIDSVRLGAVQFGTGNDEGFNGYVGDFSAIQGGTVAFQGRPGFSGTAFSETWGVWVDWNGNFAFEASEKVINSSSTGANYAIGNFIVPAGTTPGNYNVLVMMKYGSAPLAGCSVNVYDGEMEYYVLNVSASTCSNITVEPTEILQSPTSVHIVMQKIPKAETYNLQFRVAGTTTWSATQSSPKNYFTLTGLTANTNYEYRIRVKCPAGFTTYNTALYTFNTNASTLACNRPTQLSNATLTPYAQQLFWNYSNNAISYRIRSRINTLPAIWTTKTVLSSTTTTTIQNLKPGTNYIWQVQTLCPPGLAANYSSYSALNSFTTLGNGNALVALPEDSFEDGVSLNGVKLAPNPASDDVKIIPQVEIEVASLNITNLNGQVVRMYDGMPENNTLVIKDLSTGVYFVNIIALDGSRYTEKLIKL